MLGKFLTPCEDSMTAAVFTHLLHLPSDLFWQVLNNACPADELPLIAGELLDYKFWPKWSATGTSNSRYVEPDIFMRFRLRSDC